MTVSAGTRVQIRRRLLEPGQRASGLPPETAALPYEAVVRGALVADAEVGAEARIRTSTGRELTGRLEVVEPADTHTFGRPPAALVATAATIDQLVRGLHDER